jgi:hypothetical protein
LAQLHAEGAAGAGPLAYLTLLCMFHAYTKNHCLQTDGHFQGQIAVNIMAGGLGRSHRVLYYVIEAPMIRYGRRIASRLG